jgi:hypothetical protein
MILKSIRKTKTQRYNRLNYLDGLQVKWDKYYLENVE